jgi:phosphoribosylamine--glycine ligase
VAGGYPDEYKKGDVITGWDSLQDVLVFHAGTAKQASGEIVTNGGRVVALTGIGKDIQEALSKSNAAAQTLNWNGKFFRKDIGLDLIE